MLNLKDIVVSNRETFYDYSIGVEAKTSSCQWPKIILAIILALAFPNLNKDFLGLILSTYAILTGFGFNILFYLLNFQVKANSKTIEGEIKSEKLTTLSKEIFYNVAYFNIASVLLIILCIACYLSTAQSPETLEKIQHIKDFIWAPSPEIQVYLIKLRIGFELIFCSFFYYCLIESIFSFVRITDRVFYLFKNVIITEK